MRLSSYIQRTRALMDMKVQEHEIEAIGQIIADGGDLAAVLKKRTNTLTPRALLAIWQAAERRDRHQTYLREVARRRREGRQSQIAPALLKQTLKRHEVAVLERAEADAPPGRAAEHRRRDAIKEAVALFNACMTLLRKEGALHIEQVEDGELDATVAELVGDRVLDELTDAQWIAVRAAERAGTIELSIDIPEERLIALVSGRGAELSAITAGRDAATFLGQLVLVDLDEWTLLSRDDEAGDAAIADSATAYHALLMTPRPALQMYAGIWLSDDGETVGLGVTMRDGRFVTAGVAAVDGDVVKAVETLLGPKPVEALVLPETGNEALVQTLREGFASLELLEGSQIALEEGAAENTETLEPAASKAVVMARRCVRPLKFWGQIDPLALGLIDPQVEVDETLARARLQQMRSLALAGVKPTDLLKPSAIDKPKAQAPLNPLLKSIEDLRPGMEVDGLVTNITQFGAFLNIGLGHEGLVHVSELADHFVNDPKEVVTVGQAVKARVLGVDRARRRISLSLRPERTTGTPSRTGPDSRSSEGGGVLLDDIPGRRGRRNHVGFGTGPRPHGGRGPSRDQALADLEALFKKK